MRKFLTPGLALAMLLALSAPAGAGELQLSMQNGRVTIVAKDVPLRQIMSEWARVGQTKIVNVDKIASTPVTYPAANTSGLLTNACEPPQYEKDMSCIDL